MRKLALAALYRASVKSNQKSNLHSKYIAKTVSHASYKKIQRYFCRLLKQLHKKKKTFSQNLKKEFGSIFKMFSTSFLGGKHIYYAIKI